MTACIEYELLLAQQLDGMLTDTEMQMLRSHLATCAPCRKLEEELRQISQDFPVLMADPPSDLEARIMQRIREDAAVQPTVIKTAPIKTINRRWLSTAAAFFIIITATVIGSRILPLEHELDATSGVNDATERTAAALAEASEGLVAGGQLPPPQAPINEQYGADSGQATTKRISDHNTTADAATAVAGSDPNATPYTAAEPDALMQAAPPQSLASPASTEATTQEENSRSETPAQKGLPASTPLDTATAELLLREYLALPAPSSVTLEYQGLSPDGDAHLFWVVWSPSTTEAYFVNRLDGTITLRPASDSTPSTTP